MLKEKEKLLDLERRGLSLIQDEDGYAFTMDAVLLSDFARAYAKDKVAELGTGSGVISILMSYKTAAAQFVGIEIQERLADMATRSVAYNNLQHKITIHNGDIKTACQDFGKHCFDVVVTNPPYMEFVGDKSTATEQDICKREVCITLNEVVKCASDLLKFGGNFFVIIKADRLVDLVCAMREHKIEPKKIVPVLPKATKQADTILVEGKKCGNKSLILAKPLIVFNEDGSYTDELRRIYNK